MELITTTVSVDAQKAADQVIIHLVKGDSGTRRFQFVPIEGGHLIDVSAVAMAKVQAYSQATTGSLLIDCVIESGKVYMTPTPAFVASVDEWACQLVLLVWNEDIQDYQTLTSMPFTTIIHGRVYEGDAVEHTNVTLEEAAYDAATKTLILTMADGSVISVSLDHVHANATTTAAGFESATDKANLDTLVSRVDQDLRTNAATTPSFPSLSVGAVTIYNDGTVTGLRFT
jgi:hypothetical protein